MALSQLAVVWSLLLTAGSEGPTLISCTTSHLLSSVRSWHTVVCLSHNQAARSGPRTGPRALRIKQCLSLQKDTCQGKQSVCDTTESTSVRVAAFAHGSISGATPGIALGGDTCPVIDRVAQSNVRSVAPDDDE